MWETVAAKLVASCSVEYIPFGPNIWLKPHVIVDGGHGASTVLDLSHWPGNKTPAKLRADTSTEIVINALRDPDAAETMSNCGVVTLDHFDIDGLLSLWSVLNRNEALANSTALIDIATTGDFDRYTTSSALAQWFELDQMERVASKQVRASANSPEEFGSELVYLMLPKVAEVLKSEAKLKRKWRTEVDNVVTDLKELAEIKTSVDPKIGLTMFEHQRAYHRVAVNSACRTGAIIESKSGVHSFRYRYETFVEMKSQQFLPRGDISGALQTLNEIEESGYWHYSGYDTAHPILWLYAGDIPEMKSSISFEHFVGIICKSLHESSESTLTPWRESSTAVLPPSVHAARKIETQQ